MVILLRGDYVYEEKYNNYFMFINVMRFIIEGLEGIVKCFMKDLYEKIYNKCYEM